MPRQEKSEYAVYKGDEFICLGTARECAENLGMKIPSFRILATPSYKKRFAKKFKPNALEVIVLEDDE